MDAESELMDRIKEGDEKALAELYRRLSGQIYALARRLTGTPEDAEEVLQDTFFKVFKEARRYRSELGSPRAYIYTIARNGALARLRAKRARPQRADAYDVHDPASPMRAGNPHDPAERVALRGALEELEPQSRQLLMLAFYDGYSHNELAQLTGLPLGTVKSRVRRALLELRRRLEGHEAS